MVSHRRNSWRTKRTPRSRDVILAGADIVDMQFYARGWGVKDTALITANVTRKIDRFLTTSPWPTKAMQLSLSIVDTCSVLSLELKGQSNLT